MLKIRSRPTETEAMLYDGTQECARQIQAWAHDGLPPEAQAIISIDATNVIRVRTNTGLAFATAGDYIIKGPTDFYPCDPDTFAKRWQAPDTEIVVPPETRLAMAINAVADEVSSAMKKHAPMNSHHEAYAVILEEMDEYWDEVKLKREKRDPQAMRKELVQIAAMATRAVVDLKL